MIRDRNVIAQGRAGLRHRNALFVRLQKIGQPCTDCGGIFPPVAMDFDHVRGEKTAGILKMVRGQYSLAAIAAEIEKCELVCACCHRVRTAGRLPGAYATACRRPVDPSDTLQWSPPSVGVDEGATAARRCRDACRPAHPNQQQEDH